MSPAEFVGIHAHLAKDNVIIHTTNEPPDPNNTAVARQLVDWHSEVIRLSAPHGLKLCILNFGAGGPDVDKWHLYDELLRLVANNRDRVTVGLHEYAAGVIFSGMEFNADTKKLGVSTDWRDWAGDHYPSDPEYWSSVVDTSTYNFWHIGRYKHMFDYCDANGITRPNVIFTEWGYDQLTDPISDAYLKELAQKYPPVAPYEHYRSWRSLESVWEQWEGMWSQASQLWWANDNIYTEPEVLGMCLFAVSNAQDWKHDFDYSDNNDLLSHLVGRYARERLGEPDPSPVPDPVPVPVPVPDPIPVPDPVPDDVLDDVLSSLDILERKVQTTIEIVNTSHQTISGVIADFVTHIEDLKAYILGRKNEE
jgi:hypothetical protein